MIRFSGYNEIIDRVYAAGQQQVFEVWNQLSDGEKINLLEQLKKADLPLLERLYASSGSPEKTAGFGPEEIIHQPVTEADFKERALAEEAGLEAIRQGRTAAFIVAGGQGSRLGFDGPKGMYPAGPVSGKSLFQFHGEKLRKYSMKYGVSVPWLVMTSEMNHQATCRYFRKMNYFGLDRKDVFIFPQNMIPSLDSSGKLVLESPCSLFRNPDGHGGSLSALKDSGALDMLKSRGVDIISYFQVDNPLIKIADPVFTGYHILRGADVSSKAIMKTDPGEKVGVFVKFDDGRSGVVEYSDLPAEKAEQTDSSGNLVYRAGSVAIHLFNVSFIESITSGTLSLPYHTARKKISIWTEDGIKQTDGLKFEKFVFDSLPLAHRTMVMEISREEEFAPVKNAEGNDSPETSRALMDGLYRKWLRERNIFVPERTKTVEITPLTAVEAGDLPSDLILPDKEQILL